MVSPIILVCHHPDCNFNHQSPRIVQQHERSLHSTCREPGCQFRGSDSMLAVHEAQHNWSNGPPEPIFLEVDFVCLDFLFLTRGETFNGLGEVTSAVWPEHSLATMNYIINKNIRRWLDISREFVGEALIAKYRAEGLIP